MTLSVQRYSAVYSNLRIIVGFDDVGMKQQGSFLGVDLSYIQYILKKRLTLFFHLFLWQLCLATNLSSAVILEVQLS